MTLEFEPKVGRDVLDEAELVEQEAAFGIKFSASYLKFLRNHHDSYFLGRNVGYQAFPCSLVLTPSRMKAIQHGHFWGPEFVPFMSGDYGAAAFDLRGRIEDPPVVFLDWYFEDEENIRYDKIAPIAENFDAFTRVMGVWSGADLPSYTECFEDPPFAEIDVQPESWVLPNHVARPGWRLRNGVVGPSRLNIGQLMGCVAACDEDPELVGRLTISTTWERLKLVHGPRLIPIMCGSDGWLALDYRATDASPPVVVVHGADGAATGDVGDLAESVLDAFSLYE